MPNSRYIRLQELVFDSFILNAPVEIEKGVLLLDSQSKAVLLQLKLNILVEDKSTISSVRLKIFGYDDAGNELEEFSPYSYSTYRDIYLNPAPTFGEKTPILLNHKVRKVKVELDQVVYRDGNVWTTSEKEIKLPLLRTINQLDGELIEQLKREIVNFTPDQKKQAVYLPQQLDNYWICACGRPNINEVNLCCRCGLDRRKVFSKINESNLANNLEDINKQKKFTETKLLLEKEKRSKRTKLASLLLLGIVLIFVLSFYIIIPTIKNNIIPTINYNQAIKYLENQNFDSAIAALESLQNFNDSPEMLKEAKFQKANYLFNNNHYTEAKEIYADLGNYKDSISKLKLVDYYYGIQLLNDQECEEAISIFNKLSDFDNSIEYLKESQYCFANELVNEKLYWQALNLYEKINGYKDSSQLIIETKYLLALDLISKNNIKSAIPLLEQIIDYKDSRIILDKSVISLIYEAGIEYYNNGNFDQAQENFYYISPYEDSINYLNKLTFLIKLQGTWKDKAIDEGFEFKGWRYCWVFSYVDQTYKCFDIPKNSVTETGISITNDKFRYELTLDVDSELLIKETKYINNTYEDIYTKTDLVTNYP